MKKILYTLIILTGITLTSCQKGEQGLPGKNGTAGVTGTTKGSTGATGAKGTTGSLGNIEVAVKDTTITTNITIPGNNFGGFDLGFYDFDGSELFLKNSDGSFSPLPCDINDKFSLNYSSVYGNLLLRLTNKSSMDQLFSIPLNIRIVTYQTGWIPDLKHHAGGLDYNHLQKYLKLP